MSLVLAAIALHVGMGTIWALATLTSAIGGRIGPIWKPILLGTASLNMLAGVYLWHALHAGPWGPREHLLVVGTFCALIALGIQLPIVMTASSARRLEPAALTVYRATLALIFAAATAMLASRIA